jgi:predicted TIM-barrel fold metal-dependent hydrolase
MQTPWGECAVSDAHTHFFSRRFFDALTRQVGRDSWAADVAWTVPPDDAAELARVWAAELDRHNVGRASLIASIPGDEASVLAAAAALPDRFFTYSMVDPTAANATVAEGLHAICLFPAMHRYSMHDERVTKLLDQAVERHCAVFVHCGVLTVGIRKKLGLPCPFDMRYSNPLDLHAIALRYSKLRFIVPHFGAGYFREALMLADLCPNVYLDTSSSNSWMRYEGLDLKTVFRRALQVAGPSRLLFGTDSSFFPRGWHAAVFEAQSQSLFDLGVSAPDAAMIFGGNLERLFTS